VSPAAVGSVLVLGVLAVVDQQRRVAGECVPGDPVGFRGREVLS
jgi:hypothetical protein